MKKLLQLFVCFFFAFYIKAEQPQKVFVGTYLHNVESIDMATNSYYMNFYIWFKWKGKIDPTENFKFLNTIDEWGITVLPVYDSVITLSDGYKYQRFHVEGRFFHKFWLGTFPLDWQKVIFEIADSKNDKQKLIYIPDTTNSTVNKDLEIPGWDIIKTYNETKTLTFNTDFGEGQEKNYSKYRFGIKIHRPVKFFLNKILPPVFVTILCCILIFSLHVSYVDARVSTAIGALLTEVFLQLSFTGNLPNVGIMLLLDHIFNFSYFIILMILVVIIYTTHLFDKQEELEEKGNEEQALVLARKIRFIDMFSMIFLSIFFIIGVYLIAFFIRGYVFNIPK